MKALDKFRMLWLVPLFALGTVSAAAAGMRLNVDSLSADGQEVRRLSCDMEDGGLMATLTIVGTLAKQKAALDRCAPKGAAFATKFTWKGKSASDIKVTGAATAEQNSCVAKVLGKITPPTDGTCSVIVLVGEQKAAQAAAQALLAK